MNAMRMIILLIVMLVLITPYGAEAQDELEGLYKPHQGENSNSISQPHRGVSELSQYITDRTVEFFSIGQNTMKRDLLAHRDYFSQTAFRSYLQFLQNSGYLPVMQSMKLDMSGLGEGAPLLLDKGVIDGLYRWSFSVPVKVILGGNSSLPISKLPRPEVVNIRMQITRDADGPEPHQVLITDFERDETSLTVRQEGATAQ